MKITNAMWPREIALPKNCLAVDPSRRIPLLPLVEFYNDLCSLSWSLSVLCPHDVLLSGVTGVS